MPKRALLIINRKSRSGGAEIDGVLDRLRAHGVELVECVLDRPQQIAGLIRSHCQDVDCVIVGGGDGTMNAAAQVLAGSRLPLGLLPLGTANDLARTLGIPTDLEQAADIICDGIAHRIDLGRVNGHYFFNAASIGLGVHVTHTLSPDLKRRWGVLSYLRGLLLAAKSFRPFHADIVCDGKRQRVRSMQIAVGNGRYYGGGMTVAEDAAIDDQEFFLYSVEPVGWCGLARFAPAFRTGRYKDKDPVLIEQGRRIEIVTHRRMEVSADGEIVTHTPAVFDMMAGTISVFVPRQYLEDQKEVLNVAQG